MVYLVDWIISVTTNPIHQVCICENKIDYGLALKLVEFKWGRLSVGKIRLRGTSCFLIVKTKYDAHGGR